MPFAQILSNCIEALAQGSSIDECLARHPDHAAELAPLLHLVTSLQSQAKPRLSADVFQKGRTALADAAQAAQRNRPSSMPEDRGRLATHHRFVRFRDVSQQADARNGHPSPHRASPTGLPHIGTSRQNSGRHHPHSEQSARPTSGRDQRRFVPNAKRAAAPKRVANTHRLRQIISVILPLMLILGSATLLRQAAVSTPVSPIYGIKTLSERTQGLLMIAAGEGATWHANQMLRRVVELAQIATTDTTLTATLAERATIHVEQALAAGTLLPQADQRSFLVHWLTELEATKQALQQSSTPSTAALTLLQQTMTQVLAATAALDHAATEVPNNELPSAVESLPRADLQTTDSTVTAESPTPLPTATVRATAITTTTTITALTTTPIDGQPTPTRVLQATAIPTATPVPTEIQVQPATPTPVFTATPMPVFTATPMPVMTLVIPMEPRSDDDTGNRSSDQSDSNSSSDSSSTPPESGNDGPGSSDGAGDGSTTTDDAEIIPTTTAVEETTATAPPLLPTNTTPVAESTLQSTVEPDATLVTPSFTPVATTMVDLEPAEQNQATPLAPPAPTAIDHETPAPIAMTEQPPATVAPSVVAPTTPEEQRAVEERPTRTRRPTATPQPKKSTVKTKTPESVEPTVAPSDDATPMPEATDILTP